MWIIAYCLAVAVVAGIVLTSLDHFWRRCRQLERDTDRLRIELESARERVTDWAGLAYTIEADYYRLACSVFGRARVDAAVRDGERFRWQ